MAWTPDRMRKRMEKPCFYSIQNCRVWSSLLTTDSPCSLNKIILVNLPDFFGLVIAGESQPGSDALPG